MGNVRLRVWVSVLLLVGLSAVAWANLSEISQGMSREEVVTRLGDPRGRASDGRSEILYYGVDREVHLRDGVVAMVTGREGMLLQAALGGERRSAKGDAGAAPESQDFPGFLHGAVEQVSRSGLDPTGTFAFEGQWTEADLPPWAIVTLLAFFTVVMLFMLSTMWALFSKAGWPGWTSLVPIYNAYVMLKIAGKPGWWMVLMMIPVVNFIVAVLVPMGVAQRFGKGGGFGLGLFLLPWLFYPIIAFGSATYTPEALAKP